MNERQGENEEAQYGKVKEETRKEEEKSKKKAGKKRTKNAKEER
jgi:hypothetical protein